jgi:sulfhydrogenase subunit alpha
MHKEEHFSLTEITKIEGHANLDVWVKNDVVEKCHFSVMENPRYYENLVVGRNFEELPLIVSRICGFCSISHLNTAIAACEKALSIASTEQTLLLRELATNAEFMKSHALHLFMLALPDYLGKESILKFNEREHRFIHWGLQLKKIGTDLIKLLGARTYQTVNIRIGGFTMLPNQEKLEKAIPQLFEAKKTAVKAVNLFASFTNQFSFERKTDYVALVGKEYCLLCGNVCSTSGCYVKPEDYLNHLKEFIVPYSTAKLAKFEGKEFMVGALARININQKELSSDSQKLIKDLKLKFPNQSPFYNNIAQAIELVQCIDNCIRIIKNLKIRKESLPRIKPRECEGVGVTEAPRGLLYHQYKIDSKGFIKEANIIVPTLQNNRNTEEDIKAFLPTILHKPREQIEIELEKLIRAYDPCISCATHFLKVKWC